MKCRVLSMVIMIIIVSGCHTSTSFILPPNTELLVNSERISQSDKDEEGRIRLVRRPFFWSSFSGIEYALLQEDKVVKKDKLPSAFRISSIFWPPYAYLYWPLGFRFDCYDLSDPKKEYIEKCVMAAKPVQSDAQASKTADK